ncbi:MAG: Tim44/TimA family putative adaptor protein [Pseudomonadota bacterium]
MSQGFQFFDLILLGMIAAFILLRLRSVLGTRTGHEKPPEDMRPGRTGPQKGSNEGAKEGKVIQLPRRTSADGNDKALSPAEIRLRQSLTEITLADPHFDADDFCDGARQAYEMIILAFAQGNRDLLRDCVGEEVYANFNAAITAREAAGQRMETRLAAIQDARITQASLRGKMAEVTVKFTADLISSVQNAEGELVQGHPTLPQQVCELWTFARATDSSDPNWSLIATAADTANDTPATTPKD